MAGLTGLHNLECNECLDVLFYIQTIGQPSCTHNKLHPGLQMGLCGFCGSGCAIPVLESKRCFVHGGMQQCRVEESQFTRLSGR